MANCEYNLACCIYRREALEKMATCFFPFQFVQIQLLWNVPGTIQNVDQHIGALQPAWKKKNNEHNYLLGYHVQDRKIEMFD